MVFSSITFIYFFLPAILTLYYIVPKKCRNLVLLAFSLLFYFYGEQNLVLVISCILNYIFGTIIGKTKDKKYLILGIITNIAILIYYKYSNFFISNINNLLNINIQYLNIILPLGISFFTFQNMSYLIDVYKQDVPVQKNLVKYATYITLFPQLIAGPIVRYKDVDNEISNRRENFENFSNGVIRFIIGLSKKVIIANTIGEMATILNQMVSKTVVSHILEAIGYTIQIYFDFSGYSDMAIGLGLMFGFHFKENFNYPLIAKSITDFWRRWHISLTSFFRDYIYIPLGGNRVSKAKWIRNILVVWALTGFWHGASWNFIIWGLYFFIFLILEKLFLHKLLKNGLISHVYTLGIVLVSFVIFNMPDLKSIGIFLKNMTGFGNLSFINAETIYYLKNYLSLLVIAFISATPILKNLTNKIKEKWNIAFVIDTLQTISIFSLLIITTASLLSSSFNPFIYFRF